MNGKDEQAESCGYVWRALNNIDAGWDRLTAYGDKTDGIVQGSSQVYPTSGNAQERQYPINGGDSHLGETKSNLVKEQISRAFTEYFLVPTF